MIEVVPEDIHDRSGIFLGSYDEVQKVIDIHAKVKKAAGETVPVSSAPPAAPAETAPVSAAPEGSLNSDAKA